jgi:hypothetical protein
MIAAADVCVLLLLVVAHEAAIKHVGGVDEEFHGLILRPAQNSRLRCNSRAGSPVLWGMSFPKPAEIILRVAAIVLLAPAISLPAQPPGMPSGGMSSTPTINVKKFDAEKELARLTRKYRLTEDQQTKIRPVLVEQQTKVHKLGDDERLSDADWVAGVRQAHRETVAKVKLEMTDEQASRYVKDEQKRAKSDQEDQGSDGPPGGGPDGGPPPGGGGPP